ncbi:Protein of unknown function DUF309 [Cinnamomum micranthum f. kanehirae]|uniref:TTHA0068-like domain-containing protein n=1 Tax=Cinnamomum micranthum f. kanehirae TaxID=337451 RepID=A0A443NXX2_9MAGN|nr:Protein of unknown function DUF309 [Cinnamomum micranthum f. kanehirae]
MASSSPSLFLLSLRTFSLPSLPQRLTPFHHRNIKTQRLDSRLSYRRFWTVDFPEGESDGQDSNFDCAVSHFNSRDFYRCHDFLEHLWYGAEEPRRTVIHGLLQCAVGFHHLFNQNHRGAMMELGEGLCKLRKMNFADGPLYDFEKEISAVLDFIYHTQLELAACTDDFCLAMDGSERSYQLLGTFAAGQHLYRLERDPDDIQFIVFCPEASYSSGNPAKVKIPTLHATEEHLNSWG